MRHSPLRFGVSLLEMIIFVGILFLMTGAIATFVLLSDSVRVRSSLLTDVQQNGGEILQWTQRAISEADAIVSPVVGASGSTLILVKHDPAAEVIIAPYGDKVMVFENGQKTTSLTSTHVILPDGGLRFFHFGEDGRSGGVSVHLVLGNAEVGTYASRGLSTQTFAMTVVRRSAGCTHDDVCPDGLHCCGGFCRERCLSACQSTADCSDGEVCCIFAVDTGSSECTAAEACLNPQCETLFDCPSPALTCDLSGCMLSIPSCRGGSCVHVPGEKCASCEE